jgi:tRNA modification GTPase
MSVLSEDTIAAISTQIGEGGIGVVRISGPAAFGVSDALFESSKKGKPSEYKSHTVHYGRLRHPSSGEPADEVLLTVMRGPATYTAEDVVEISCHGGRVSLKKVLDLCLSAGARLAEPGEFTKRAFLNGRIDLSQAEAVLDIINAETSRAQSLALEQLRGGLSEKVRSVRQAVIDILSFLELAIDFSDQDASPPDPAGISRDIKGSSEAVRQMLDAAEKGMIFRTGLSAVICGRPNAGKSSLMNALLRHERVIVTPVPGTTRDVIEESIDIGGVKVRLSDTAGIIETRDRVEMEGIRRSREKLDSADVVIFMIDSSRPLSDKDLEIYDAVRNKNTVVVMNKTDLAPAMEESEVKKKLAAEEIVPISVVEKCGLDDIEDAIIKALTGGKRITSSSPLSANARHIECLKKSACALERALRLTEKAGFDPVLAASDLSLAAHELGLITGESIEDDILERIFSRFCIGK